MNVKKYVDMDVHKETISVAVMNGEGSLVMESIVETKASTIPQFVQGLQGDLHWSFELNFLSRRNSLQSDLETL
jgi:hypothetical protein